jgi:hypothetical protein
MYYYGLAVYMLWQHYYIIDYAYNVYYYGKIIKSYMSSTTKDNVNDEEWIYLEQKDEPLIIQKY